MPNDNIPIEGYPNEFLEFFKAAALEPKRIWFTTSTDAAGNVKTGRSKCFVIRARLNNLRARMKRESHPLYERIAKVSLTIEGDDGHNCHGAKGQVCPDFEGRHCVYGRQRDSELLGAFHDAGITAETLDNDPLAGLTQENLE